MEKNKIGNMLILLHGDCTCIARKLAFALPYLRSSLDIAGHQVLLAEMTAKVVLVELFVVDLDVVPQDVLAAGKTDTVVFAHAEIFGAERMPTILKVRAVCEWFLALLTTPHPEKIKEIRFTWTTTYKASEALAVKAHTQCLDKVGRDLLFAGGAFGQEARAAIPFAVFGEEVGAQNGATIGALQACRVE